MCVWCMTHSLCVCDLALTGTLAGIVVVVVVLVLVVVSGLGLFILSVLFPHKAQRFLHCKQDIEVIIKQKNI